MMSQPIKCRAAVLYKEGERLAVENVLVNAPDQDQVRIKMVAAGICATDAHHIWGHHKVSEWNFGLPIILGHEGSAIVESVGANVTEFKPGDHVLVTCVPQCKECSWCKIPDVNCCQNLFNLNAKFKGRLADKDDAVWGFNGLCTFSEYSTVYQNQIIKIDKRANLQNACIISCAVTTGFYSAVHMANVRSESTCAIWGIGAIGLFTIAGCKFNKSKNIIAIDINSDKREMAMKFGATEFVNPKELDCPVEKYLLEKYSGVDYAFDCFGGQVTIDQALNSLNLIGKFTLVGVTTNETINYPAKKLITGQSITSGLIGNIKNEIAYENLIELYLEKKLMVDEAVTHKFKLDNIQEAFDLLKTGQCIRSIIIY